MTCKKAITNRNALIIKIANAVFMLVLYINVTHQKRCHAPVALGFRFKVLFKGAPLMAGVILDLYPGRWLIVGAEYFKPGLHYFNLRFLVHLQLC